MVLSEIPRDQITSRTATMNRVAADVRRFTTFYVADPQPRVPGEISPKPEFTHSNHEPAVVSPSPPSEGGEGGEGRGEVGFPGFSGEVHREVVFRDSGPKSMARATPARPREPNPAAHVYSAATARKKLVFEF